MIQTFTKPIFAFLLLFLLGFVSACYFSNCPPPILYYLRGVEVRAFDKVQEQNTTWHTFYTDTLQHSLNFEVTPEVEIAAIKRPFAPQNSLLSVAYGQCSEEEVLNPIFQQKCKLTLNRSFTWQNQRIEPYTNLLEMEGLKDQIEFPKRLEFEAEALISIPLEEALFKNALHTFYFEWETQDEMMLKDSVTVFLSF